jgi:hypothetical protein
MEKKIKTQRRIWLIIGIILALAILARIIVPIIQKVDPNL